VRRVRVWFLMVVMTGAIGHGQGGFAPLPVPLPVPDGPL